MLQDLMDSQGSLPSGDFLFPFTQRTLPSTPPSTQQQQQPSSQTQLFPSTQRTIQQLTPPSAQRPFQPFASSPPSSLSHTQQPFPSSQQPTYSQTSPAHNHFGTVLPSLFRPHIDSLRGFSTPYDPSANFSSTNKRLMASIQDILKVVQDVSNSKEDKGSLAELIDEIKNLVDKLDRESSRRWEENNEKVDEVFNTMRGLVEKLGEKVGESGDLIQEGLKKVTITLEDMAGAVDRVDERQELMMKEIENLRDTTNEMKTLIEKLLAQQQQQKEFISGAESQSNLPINTSHKRSLPAEDETPPIVAETSSNPPPSTIAEPSPSAPSPPATPSTAPPPSQVIIYNISESRLPIPTTNNLLSSSTLLETDPPSEIMQNLIKRRRLALQSWMEGIQSL